MGVILYHFPPSGPSRGALLAAKAIGVDVEVKITDLLQGDHRKPEFLKINPQHTVPTLVDGNEFSVWDSHAIACYLANSYAKDDTIYPQEPKMRALVEQRLQFDCGVLYPRVRQICFPVLFLGEDQIYDEHRQELEEALGFLDVFLEGNKFVCGNHLTIADCCLIASVSSIVAIGWDISSYRNVISWIVKCESSIPDYAKANQEGADKFGAMVRSKLAPGQL